MPTDIREYLLDRFRTDAATLRHRAESLKGATKPSPGPDAALSIAMAAACDNVVALAELLPVNAPVDVMLDALQVLVPKLTQLAETPQAATSPAIRSVYVGACTRAQELIAAELSAARPSVPSGLDDDDDEAFDDDFVDDGDIDDDDVDDDDLCDDHPPEEPNE